MFAGGWLRPLSPSVDTGTLQAAGAMGWEPSMWDPERPHLSSCAAASTPGAWCIPGDADAVAEVRRRCGSGGMPGKPHGWDLPRQEPRGLPAGTPRPNPRGLLRRPGRSAGRQGALAARRGAAASGCSLSERGGQPEGGRG